jgi:hypothetical protein
MYICTSQSLFSHLYVVNEGLNRHCNVQLDIGIRADELGINRDCIAMYKYTSELRADELGTNVILFKCHLLL